MKNNCSTAFDELHNQLKRLEKDLQVKKMNSFQPKSIFTILFSTVTHLL